MNLPISWLVAGAIPANQAVKQVANVAATSASHFFGDLLHSNRQPKSPSEAVSGPSVPNESLQNPKANSESKSWSSRVDSLRTYLTKFVSDTRARYGQNQEAGDREALAISANGKGRPHISGPEPIRTELEQLLQSNPDLTKEVNDLATLSSKAAPLRLMPNTAAASKENEPWKLWLDG